MTELAAPQPTKKKTSRKTEQLVFDLLLVALLLAAAFLRFTGIDWGEGQFLHPDEGFLTTVETRLAPVHSLSEYWDTATSTLNPGNSDYTFFVYGTLPIFTVRYLAEWLGQTGWGDVMVVGRYLSAISDLGVVLLVYLIASRLYDQRVGIIAAAFSAFSVLNIQLSHFFAVDTFLTFFTMLTIYVAVLIATEKDDPDQPALKPLWFVLFGVALGMAVSSKINTAPVALTLPLAVWVRISHAKKEERFDMLWTASGWVLLAAVVSILTFRIFQPYAFQGPGFFGLMPNPEWVDTLSELLDQQSGNFDWPPSIQWARRPVWFSFQNMVLWGMGLPMAIMAWLGFLWSGWQMFKGRWRTHLIVWVWTAVFFAWQSMAFNPTMRYQIPVYPPLAIFAGWAVVSLWDAAGKQRKLRTLLRIGAGTAGAAALLLTAVWAVAFASIYTRPVTRIAASRWIYQNIPGPINMVYQTKEGSYTQPLNMPYDLNISPDLPYLTSFVAKQTGMLEQATFKNISADTQTRQVSIIVSEAEGIQSILAVYNQEVSFEVEGNLQAVGYVIDSYPPVLAGEPYVLEVSVPAGQEQVSLVGGYIQMTTTDGVETILVDEGLDAVLDSEGSYTFTFRPTENGTLSNVMLNLQAAAVTVPEEQVLEFTLGTTPELLDPLAQTETTVNLSGGSSSEGGAFVFEQPVAMLADSVYYFRIANLTEGGKVILSGSGVANEGPWDLGLPLSVDGYSGYNGLYQRELELGMYTDDNPEKLANFLEILDDTEYFTISSSRQWGSTTRIPERYPLNVVFYRHMLGCPEDRTIEWCYNVAQPGTFSGDLGFELVQTFESDPEIFGWTINDQFAEEAFTVYDHPKVFIFQKTDAYDSEKTAAILGSVDFDAVIRLTPLEASDFKSLMLTDEARQRQEEGGTWSELYNSETWFNQSGLGAVVVWYLALSLLSWACFPLIRRALPGLPDNGYPLARTGALLLLAYFSWLAGSIGLSYTRPVIVVIYLGLLALGVWQGWKQRVWLKQTLRARWRYYLLAEAVFLGAFILVLLVRYGNPDLWHPYKGGEKPMDFAYFNAVLKSVSFPAYDPWYAGGYINYYYFGFVFLGTLVKMLGIVPALAYNIVLPTLFAMIAAGAFSVSWNLYVAWSSKQEESERKSGLPAWAVGLSGALVTAVLGNQGTVKMLFEGMQRLAANGEYADQAGFLTKVGWTIAGMIRMFTQGGWPFGTGSWYWEPSRVIPALNEVEPITEFPWFTTIYADLHAHFMALALVFLGLSWAISVVLGKSWRGARRGQVVWSFLFAGIAIGALRPTNTWDFPTYLALGVVALVYAIMRRKELPGTLQVRFGLWGGKIVLAAAGVAALVGLSFVLYQPFASAYSLPYSEIKIWTGTHTPLGSYFTHWGLFLFILVFWMGWETRQWMATTPLSSLRKLEKYRVVLWGTLFILLLVIVILVVGFKVRIHLLALPLAVWVAVLLFRPGIGEAKRVVLFMVGTALFLTILVEVVVLSGDIARMNTVFKFYLQAWVLLAASSAAALGWTVVELRQWRPAWRELWKLGAGLLVLGAALYPLTATQDKIVDRMAQDAPHTLNGMTFMEYSTYPDEGGILELEQDYRAIRWMQENVSGTPTIVEGITPLYRWGSRFSIYTGLPTVLGWDWHQTQQRGFSPTSEISDRQFAVNNFYATTDPAAAAAFLQDYDVQYVIVGQLERNYYAGAGMDKFDILEGELWEEVYRDGQTVIYRVLGAGLGE